jgi:predicted RNase H-like HicB family nuclease
VIVVKTIRVILRQETKKNWWADSPDLQGYFAGAETCAELRHLINEGIPFFLGEPAEIIEIFDEPAPAKTA